MMFDFFSSLIEGLDERIKNSLYICMLSALIISPFNFFAKWIANFDLPEPVGPAIKINFFNNLV